MVLVIIAQHKVTAPHIFVDPEDGANIRKLRKRILTVCPIVSHNRFSYTPDTTTGDPCRCIISIGSLIDQFESAEVNSPHPTKGREPKRPGSIGPEATFDHRSQSQSTISIGIGNIQPKTKSGIVLGRKLSVCRIVRPFPNLHPPIVGRVAEFFFKFAGSLFLTIGCIVLVVTPTEWI